MNDDVDIDNRKSENEKKRYHASTDDLLEPNQKRIKVSDNHGEKNGVPDVDYDAWTVEGLTLYDMYRQPRETIHDDNQIHLQWSFLAPELSCYICEGPFVKPYASRECIHRFCFDCISKYLRFGRKECPRCCAKLPSGRSLRQDAGIEHIINAIYPPSARPPRVSDQAIEKRIELIAEKRSSSGPATFDDDLDPFSKYYSQIGTNPHYYTETKVVPSKQSRSSKSSASKRGRPAKPKAPIEPSVQTTNAIPPPAHSAPLPPLVKLAAPVPLNISSIQVQSAVPASSTPPPSNQMEIQSNSNTTTKKHLESLEKDTASIKPILSSNTKSIPSPVSSVTSQSAPTASITNTTPSVPIKASTPIVSTATNASAAIQQQTATSGLPSPPLRKVRKPGDHFELKILPLPSVEHLCPKIPPFVIAPAAATIDHLSKFISFLASQSGDSQTHSEVNQWQFTNRADSQVFFDRSLTLESIYKQVFRKHDSKLVVFFSPG